MLWRQRQPQVAPTSPANSSGTRLARIQGGGHNSEECYICYVANETGRKADQAHLLHCGKVWQTKELSTTGQCQQLVGCHMDVHVHNVNQLRLPSLPMLAKTCLAAASGRSELFVPMMSRASETVYCAAIASRWLLLSTKVSLACRCNRSHTYA